MGIIMRWFYSYEREDDDEDVQFFRNLEHSAQEEDAYCTSQIIFRLSKKYKLFSNDVINKMKNFRSSKNLKPMDPQLKQESQLRMKIKILQDQIAMLQKSNLNIFIPLSEHPVHDTVDYQSIINKLRQQVLSLEQQNQNVKNQNKKLEKQKQDLRAKYEKEIEQMREKNNQLQKEVDRIQSEFNQLQEQYEAKTKQCQELDKKLIQKNVELKFLHEDLHEERIKKQSIEKQLKDLKHRISEVMFGSRIYKSLETKYMCISNSQYEQLKAKIAELEAKIRAIMEASKREKVSLGSRKNDVGQEIVRLKKNIDAQLGLEGNSKHSEEFLKLYKGTNQLLNQLIFKYER